MRCFYFVFSNIFCFNIFCFNFFIIESFSNLPNRFYLREKKEKDNDGNIDNNGNNGNNDNNGNNNGNNINKGNNGNNSDFKFNFGNEYNYYNSECILPITISTLIKKNGFDERFNNSNIKDLKINVIREYFYKMNILKILENTNISDLSKLEIVDHYYYYFGNNNIYKNNIKNSNIFINLMDDWDNGLI